MPDLPTGTVTFLFTDVEGSTRLWEQDPGAMRQALGDRAAGTAMAAGRLLSLEEALAVALAEQG
ncbi:MAG TPA: hypothetical protein VIU62_18025 [Chloroflexota bacterium]